MNKKLLLSLVAFIMLGGGAAAAYFFMQKPAVAALEEGEIVKEEKVEPESFEFVELDPLILPIIDKKGVTQVISLVVVIEVPDATIKEEVERLSPRIKDAYIRDMYGVLNDRAFIKGGVLEVEMIKRRLKKVSSEVVGDDKIRDVLLQFVKQKPI